MKYKSLVIYHKSIGKNRSKAFRLLDHYYTVGKLGTDPIFSAVFLSVCPHHYGAQNGIINVEEVSTELKTKTKTVQTLECYLGS